MDEFVGRGGISNTLYYGHGLVMVKHDYIKVGFEKHFAVDKEIIAQKLKNL